MDCLAEALVGVGRRLSGQQPVLNKGGIELAQRQLLPSEQSLWGGRVLDDLAESGELRMEVLRRVDGLQHARDWLEEVAIDGSDHHWNGAKTE